jgi:hypothetical protein
VAQAQHKPGCVVVARYVDHDAIQLRRCLTLTQAFWRLRARKGHGSHRAWARGAIMMLEGRWRNE